MSATPGAPGSSQAFSGASLQDQNRLRSTRRHDEGQRIQPHQQHPQGRPWPQAAAARGIQAVRRNMPAAHTLAEAHCAASGCHRTFGGVHGFDKHRRDGACLNPSDLGMSSIKGIWRVPMSDEARARFIALK